jgi:hypothetical protein
MWSPRRNRTGDPILTMNLALTAVRTGVSGSPPTVDRQVMCSSLLHFSERSGSGVALDSEHLRASKWQPTAVRNRVCAGRFRPSQARLGVLMKGVGDREPARRVWRWRRFRPPRSHSLPRPLDIGGQRHSRPETRAHRSPSRPGRDVGCHQGPIRTRKAMSADPTTFHHRLLGPGPTGPRGCCSPAHLRASERHRGTMIMFPSRFPVRSSRPGAHAGELGRVP